MTQADYERRGLLIGWFDVGCHGKTCFSTYHNMRGGMCAWCESWLRMVDVARSYAAVVEGDPMSAGDPFCPVHGFQPCQCHDLRFQVGQINFGTVASGGFVPTGSTALSIELDALKQKYASLVAAIRALPRHVVQIGGSELQDGGLVQHCAVIVYAADLDSLLTAITGADQP